MKSNATSLQWYRMLPSPVFTGIERDMTQRQEIESEVQ